MDTKRLVIGMLLTMAIMLAWQPAFEFIGRRLGYDMTPRKVTQSTPATAPSDDGTGISPGASIANAGAGTTNPSAATNPIGGLTARGVETATTVDLGSAQKDDPIYPMLLSISSEGAGLNQVTLNGFTASARSDARYVFQQPYPGATETTKPLATRVVTVNGQTIDLTKVNWRLKEKQGEKAAVFEVDLLSNGQPIARLEKKFELQEKGDKNGPRGYEVVVSQRIFNDSADKPLEVKTTWNGPTTPPVELERGSDRSLVAGYQSGPGLVEIGHHYVEEFSGSSANKDYITHEKHGYPMLWAGVSSVYFSGIVYPVPPAKGEPAPYLEAVKVQALNPEADAQHRHVAMTFATKPITIEPGKTATVPVRVFFGPKQREVLNEPYYASYPYMYDLTLVMTSGPCGFCTFQWLINALVSMLGFFYLIFRDWGLAIIALVCVVRACLHPITKRAQINMAKMGKMGPEMERLKKKHGDNKDELNRAMMQFYKEQGATPILGCLPMFLQMPIWIALYSALQSTFELRQAPFLHFFGIPFTWIHDLSQPDHLVQFSQPFTFFFLHVSGLNVLPILLGGVFWLQNKYTPKPPATTPEQIQQQKMMQWMTLLFPVFLYSGPSGLNLYILTSTTIGIIESKIIRKHLKEREEAEKEGRVIVDAPVTRGSKQASRNRAEAEQPKQGGIGGWLATLQQKAEDFQKEVDRRKKDQG